MFFSNKYKFSNKSQTLGGVISTLMGIGALTCLGAGIYKSFKLNGEAGIDVGSLGLMSLMMSVIGLIIGLLSFREDDKFYTLSKFGSMLCGILAIFMIAVALMGLGL